MAIGFLLAKLLGNLGEGILTYSIAKFVHDDSTKMDKVKVVEASFRGGYYHFRLRMFARFEQGIRRQ